LLLAVATLVAFALVVAAFWVYWGTAGAEFGPCSLGGGNDLYEEARARGAPNSVSQDFRLFPPALDCTAYEVSGDFPDPERERELASKTYPGAFGYGVALVVILAPSAVFGAAALRRRARADGGDKTSPGD
jgi:hypothetical protein